MAEQSKKDALSGGSSSGSSSGKAAPATQTGKSSAADGKSGHATSMKRMGNGSATGLMDQIKTTASDAYGTATSKATEKIEEQKSNLSSGLSSVADNIRKLGDNLTESDTPDGFSKVAAQYSGSAADKIEQAAQYFDRHDLHAMFQDAENFARRNPAVILGGAFALGFLAARFLKSSQPGARSAAAGRTFDSNPQQQRRSQARAQAM